MASAASYECHPILEVRKLSCASRQRACKLSKQALWPCGLPLVAKEEPDADGNKNHSDYANKKVAGEPRRRRMALSTTIRVSRDVLVPRLAAEAIRHTARTVVTVGVPHVLASLALGRAHLAHVVRRAARVTLRAGRFEL